MRERLPEIETASLTHVGLVRTKNQDACAEFVSSNGTRLLVVADGMGGHRGGEVASAAAIQAIGQRFELGVEDPIEFLGQAFGAANEEILRLSSENPRLSRMGTTGVAVLILPDRSAFVANVGDSRAYRLRGGKLAPITLDHSWVAEQVRAGRMSAEEAATHPRRNVLSRCIGIQAAIEVDIDPVEVHFGDQFLLCSDGLWGLVPDPEIASVLESDAPSAAVERLIELANSRGGQDNITAQIARVPGQPQEDEQSGATQVTAVLDVPGEPDPADAPRRGRLIAAGIGILLLFGLAYLLLGGGDAAAAGSEARVRVAQTTPPAPECRSAFELER